MPKIMVFRDPKVVDDNVVKMISKELTEAVAIALDVPEDSDARLVSDNIKPKVIDCRPEFDFNADPLEILIYANDYPKRR